MLAHIKCRYWSLTITNNVGRFKNPYTKVQSTWSIWVIFFLLPIDYDHSHYSHVYSLLILEVTHLGNVDCIYTVLECQIFVSILLLRCLDAE